MANHVFLSLIKTKLDTFTKSERKIAEYILKNHNDILDATITELAEKINTSDASIARFCKTLGCKGYQDFKIRLAKEILPKYKQLNVSIEKNDTPEILCQKIFNCEIATLHENLEIVNVDTLKEAAEHIKSADHVEIFGSGGSFIIGQDIKHKFLKIGIRCSVISDIDMQSMSASLLKKGDVVIGISHSGGTKSIFHCLDIAKKNGAFIILLTATAKSPMSRLADIVIPVISKETLFKSESNAARIAELVIMDVILAILVSDNNYKNYDKKIHATRMSTSENKF
ncbi:MurR/RpiR family transcriptional regulator [Megamonas hypermegale]|uniref:MurR/RpiR family transcriptional regulator n=1 Tax=Megamonas hypermegale TaxID=158847 RepID=UPI0026E9567A|nr:MurR/RpiR family transcriptional regulator [Megamonas hypermegale]